VFQFNRTSYSKERDYSGYILTHGEVYINVTQPRLDPVKKTSNCRPNFVAPLAFASEFPIVQVHNWVTIPQLFYWSQSFDISLKSKGLAQPRYPEPPNSQEPQIGWLIQLLIIMFPKLSWCWTHGSGSNLDSPKIGWLIQKIDIPICCPGLKVSPIPIVFPHQFDLCRVSFFNTSWSDKGFFSLTLEEVALEPKVSAAKVPVDWWSSWNSPGN